MLALHLDCWFESPEASFMLTCSLAVLKFEPQQVGSEWILELVVNTAPLWCRLLVVYCVFVGDVMV